MITRRQMILGLLSAGGASLCPGLLKAGGNTLLGAMSGWVFEPDRLRALLAASERILPGVVAAGFENYVNYWLVREPFNRAADWKPLLNIGAVHLDRISRRRYKRVFADCKTEQQDELLASFQRGEIKARRFSSDAFFQRLAMVCAESFLSDPKYGGNRGRVGWHFIGHQACWWEPRGKLRTGPGVMAY